MSQSRSNGTGAGNPCQSRNSILEGIERQDLRDARPKFLPVGFDPVPNIKANGTRCVPNRSGTHQHARLRSAQRGSG